MIAGCEYCSGNAVKEAICEIDTVLTNMAQVHKNNEQYFLNHSFSLNRYKDLSIYKTVLQRKLFYPSYGGYDTETVISAMKKKINQSNKN